MWCRIQVVVPGMCSRSSSPTERSKEMGLCPRLMGVAEEVSVRARRAQVTVKLRFQFAYPACKQDHRLTHSEQQWAACVV